MVAAAQPCTGLWRHVLTAGLLVAAAVPSCGFAPGMVGIVRGSGVEFASSVGSRRTCSGGALGLRADFKIPKIPGGDELAEELKGSLGRFMKSAVQPSRFENERMQVRRDRLGRGFGIERARDQMLIARTVGR